MKTFLLTVAVALIVSGIGTSGYGVVPTASYSYAVNQTVPDGLLSGRSDTRSVSLPGLNSILDLQVRLTLSGGFNGDYYAYVTHGSGFSILLNRTGRTATNPIGYGGSGFDVTFTLQPGNDIHRYENFGVPGGGLTGSWSPDGRNVNPSAVLDTTSRTALLDSFAGVDPNGSWTLFVADVDSGAQGSLLGWGLDITAVPEPASATLLVTGIGLLLIRRRPRSFKSS
jgi:subtilisin-like proprotein convertase family protein